MINLKTLQGIHYVHSYNEYGMNCCMQFPDKTKLQLDEITKETS